MTIKAFKLGLAILLISSFFYQSIPSAPAGAADLIQPAEDQLRPLFHYTPEKNWLNDPNGLVYYDGEYHMFYQYKPSGNTWGEMFWGHAVSTDLVNWEELPIALYPDELGHIFSGSVVVDWNNTSGFGDGSNPPMVAMFTQEYANNQVQSLAYSNDKGRTWTTYTGNPVIAQPSGLTVFRDPKVIWHEQTNKWVMVITAGDHVSIYSSPDLKMWSYESDFGSAEGSHNGFWETPDLFPLAVDGDPNHTKWVLTVSLSEGAPAFGSGMQYFVGEFDGTNFINNNPADEVLWADYGGDFYAGMTFSDVQDRRIWLGWMNNWHYAQTIPSAGWRGAMTVPRELTLTDIAGTGIRMLQVPAAELQQLRGAVTDIAADTVTDSTYTLQGIEGPAYEIIGEFKITDASASRFGFNVHAGDGQKTAIGYDIARSKLFVDRTKSGIVDFNEQFGLAAHEADYAAGDTLKLRILVDKTSVEVFADDGAVVFTDQLFPDPAYNQVELFAEGGSIDYSSLKVYPLCAANIGISDEKEPTVHVTETIVNPDFETGDLTGWTTVGTAFTAPVSNAATYWGSTPFHHQGVYHAWGFEGASNPDFSDRRTGEMRSTVFKLDGNGKVSFRVGGGEDINKLFVALIRESDDEILFKATGAASTMGEGYRQVEWDASDYLGQNLYLKVVDYHTGGFGHINVDDFIVYNTKPVIPAQLINPGFETGDLTGWTAEGDAFVGAVSDRTSYGSSQTPFEQEGNYHVWGLSGASEGTDANDRTGQLTSHSFILSGNGSIQFLVSGGQDLDKLYVALVRASDDAILMKATGSDSETYTRVTWDAVQYLGEEVYIKAVDRQAGDFGHINVDDFHVRGTGILGSWSFNEGQGIKANDKARNIEDKIHYVFNDAQYKPNSEPLWKTGINSYGLLFDGYSTWIERSADQITKPDEEISIEAWVAPRSYEWGDMNQLSAIVNQHDKAAKKGYILGMGRHGKWSFQAGINGEWAEVWAADDKPLNKFEWSYIVATYSKTEGKLKLYLNGELAGEQVTTNKAPISASSSPFIIGKNNTGAVINGVFTANMFNGLMDEVKVRNTALSAEQISGNYAAAAAGFENGTASKPELDFDRSVYDGDRYRPQYHFISPGHWMNEPHGPLYFEGKYHIFYQHNPQGPYWHQIHWGHAVSDDMVHWEDMPVALAPDGGSVTPDGVWSGNAVVDDNGNPALFFTAGNDKAIPNQSTGLARSTFKDDGNTNLEQWIMNETPVTLQANHLPAEEGEVWFGQFRDPYVWKDGDTWYQLVGSGIKDVGGTALLYSSPDMVNWTYENPFFVGDYKNKPETGQVWELPVLLPLGEDSNGKMKYAFFINPWFDHYNVHNIKYVFHWIGTWDKTSNKFIPDHEEPRLFDFGEHFTGPSGMVDGQGRSILFSIAQDRRTEQQHYDAGWAHNAGLPVVLTLREDGTLGVEPIEELNSLRGEKLVDLTNTNVAQASTRLRDVQGDMLEIVLEAEMKQASELGIKLRSTGDGLEETLLYYDAKSGTLNIDRTKSSLDPDVAKGVQGGEMTLDGDQLKLHIYLDRSMIEAYANGKNSITSRVYPTQSDALGLELWSEGGNVHVNKLQVWSMNSAYGETVEAYWPPAEPAAEAVGELTNHDFETGDLSGWTIEEGHAFTNAHVTNSMDWGWGGPFNQAFDRKDTNRYHLWGYHPEYGDDAVGKIKSDTFKLGGSGAIDFLVAGGKDIDKLYVALVRASDHEVLMKATGHDGEQYRRVKWDASAYTGEQLYIQIVDQRAGGWGHINVDDINVPVFLNNPSPGGPPVIGNPGSNVPAVPAVPKGRSAAMQPVQKRLSF